MDGTGHAYLPDGRLMVAGGRYAGASESHQYCQIYDPEDGANGTWTRTDDLHGGAGLNPEPDPLGQRQQGTLVVRPDGKPMIWSGKFIDSEEDPQNCTWVEVFDPDANSGAGAWEAEDITQYLTAADDLGAYMFWWNGMLFVPYGDRNSGNPQQGEEYDSIVYRDVSTSGPADWEWDPDYIETTLGGDPEVVVNRGGQMTITLLTRDYNDTNQVRMEIIMIGGHDQNDQNNHGLSTAEIFRANDPIEPGWHYVHENEVSMVLEDIECEPDGPCPYMHFARRQHSTTPLPDGRLLIIGGTDVQTPANMSDLVLDTEVYDPKEVYTLTVDGQQVEFTGSFRHLDTVDATGKRWYYHVPLLLADARVLCAGGAAFPGQSDYYFDPSLQIYSPWYLYHSPRPEITHVNLDAVPVEDIELPYGESFTVQYDTNSVDDDIDHVVLMKPGSIANKLDTDQRRLELVFSEPGAGYLCVETPPDDKDREYQDLDFGIPSEGVWIELQSDASQPACYVP